MKGLFRASSDLVISLAKNMENIVLITDAHNSIEKIAKISPLDFQRESKNVIHYSTEADFLSIIHSDAGNDEYDEAELAIVRSKIQRPAFFVIDTNNFDLLREFISTLPDRFNMLIDNNFGNIMNKREFMECKVPSDFFLPSAIRSA